MVGDFITVFTHLNTTQMACVTVPGLLHHASQCKGQIQVIFGPMFSGKTQRMGAVPCHQLFKVKGQAMKYNVIGIDEGQFFPDIAEFCEELANKGKTVIVAALDGTFQRQAFGNVLSLVPLAESVVKLNAVCMNCFKDAAFSMRLGSETQVKLIGGAERYWSVCRECFHLPKYYDIVMKLQNTHDQN
ncbi:thymidine kinase, cytosolic-like isoform X2 [Xenia sp. Carnegie-2017]|uniref:thymidine kinase, cytosolic-like isoform X2 n=1 Tax=Xenia sp. Carnegie-2017 TaxID=2897299 RepID=UPI001F035773|nr:thymidine kinase, cytosolic-like isoform X2 [Xenia sp. Carnegie-2017]